MSEESGYTLEELPKSQTFTAKLPADPLIPTPDASRKANPHLLRQSRPVKQACFTYVAPEKCEDFELLAVSPAFMQKLGLKRGEENTDEFRGLVSGNFFYEEFYPYAQAYAGWQFGSFAGQLGDGRAFSLVEVTNPDTKERYELQLKGAGKTPYSRFADGNAVLRSSIREFLASEALAALSIPTTRALSLTLLPNRNAYRETIEPCAIVCRAAQTWIRIGNFDLFRFRGDRGTLRKLCDYTINEVFRGETNLPKKREDEDEEPNRYEKMYREVCVRTAKTTAAWQAYGFMNGVLNTDNTSIYGLSIDFGPFAFMVCEHCYQFNIQDTFEKQYTPNHDDMMLRYCYSNQPSVMWWNLVKLAESLAEFLGVGHRVDDQTYIEKGLDESEVEAAVAKAESVIQKAGDEYKNVFQKEYRVLMAKRLGYGSEKETDVEEIISPLLDTLEANEMDFHLFFRRLSSTPLVEADVETAAKSLWEASDNSSTHNSEGAIRELSGWLEKYKERCGLSSRSDDEERQKRMKLVNPKFVLRNWVLQEVIDRVHDDERDVLKEVLEMTLHPFEESWANVRDEEASRWCAKPRRQDQQIQCSCSS